MLDAIEIAFHVLELLATFAVGAWTGSQRCKVDVSVSSEETRRDSWLDRLCCGPARTPPWRRGVSHAKSEP